VLSDFHFTFDYDFWIERPLLGIQADLKAQNPWNDPFIDELDLLRLSLLRDWNMRNGDYWRAYWAKLPVDDQLIAEDESNWLYAQIMNVEAIRRHYEFDVLLPLEAKKLEDIERDIGKHVWAARQWTLNLNRSMQEAIDATPNMLHLLPADRATRLVQFHGLHSLLHYNNPAHGIESELMIHPVVSEHKRTLLPVAPKPREAESLRIWRDRLHPIQAQLYHGWSGLMMDLDALKDDANELTGAGAKQHVLYSNDRIPQPDKASILGWYQLCNVATRRLNRQERIANEQLCGFTPQWITTYINPLMPMTKEHLAQGLVATDDSHSLFSLPAKSRGHLRVGETNRIEYGYWRARTVLFNKTRFYTVVDESLDSMDTAALAIHERHLDTLPAMRSTVHDVAVGRVNQMFLCDGLTGEDAKRINSLITDPYMNQQIPANIFFYGFESPSILFPWASLSKFMGVHLRFDQQMGGAIALATWGLKYQELLQWAVYATQAERQIPQFTRVTRLMKNLRSPETIAEVTVGGVKQRFDITDLL
jgi:hypothetical protein